MTETLNETRELQTEYDRLNASYEEGEIDDEEYEERSAEIEAGFDALREEASAELTDEQFAAFEPLMGDARSTQSELNGVQAAYEDGEIDEETYERRTAELQAEMEKTYGAIEDEVLAEEFAALEERAAELEEDGEELEERRAELQERGEQLEERRDRLESDAQELEERRTELEEDAAELEERRETLEQRADELEERGDELEQRADELEERGEQLQDEYEQLGEIDPTTEEAIEQLESMNESEIEEQVASTLDEDADGVFVFLPTDYEPGSAQADARMVFVTQETPEAGNVEGEAPRSIEESQLAMASIVDERFDDGLVFGSGIISDEMDRSLSDSLAIVLPLALLFVSIVLAIAYRDLLDILIGLLGVVFVLIWTVGFMGWTGIAFNVVMVAVPALLVGLSIDYAIHVFMRHREHRTADRGSTRRAMAVALSGVGLALIWVTATAMIGFLSNLISPVGPIREFGVTSAFGIAAALLIFGVLVPALKLETDAILERRGFDRRKRAFGTGGGAFSSFLALGHRAAGRAPWVVAFVTLVLTAGGVLGAAQVDTSFEQEEFLADDPPDWTKDLPEPFAPGTYTAKENLEYVNENFLRQDSRAQILIEGDVTDDRTLERIDSTEREAAERDSVMVLSSGDADVESPLSTMERVADRNESFNETFTAADTTGGGVPDEDVEEVYDALFEADEDAAAEVIHRTDDGEYEAVRMVVSVEGGASSEAVTEDMRAVAASIDGGGLEATATGQVIVFHMIENELFATVIQSLLLTLVAVFAFLMVGYRWLHGSAVLGAITLLPIVFAVAWILGTMYLLDVPFNVMTGTITSLTVGLGVAYNIHMSERYMLERRRGRSALDALYVAVTGTGGALLGSAATTIGGFGVLVFAILPPLEQFGLISGLTILYAFLGSVFVLPSFLVLWSKYLGPPGTAAAPGSEERRRAVESGPSEAPGGSD